MKKIIFSKSFKNCIIIGSMSLIFLVFYVSSKLPDELDIRMFTKGVIGVELLDKDFVKIGETIYFYKSENIAPLINYYEENRYTFYEQFGSGYLFYKNNKQFHLSTQIVSRRYSIMITQ